LQARVDFTFSIADQGRGVPDPNLETIFGRFSQVDASDSRDKGGSGLGLAICQSIVQAHGGRIWVEKNDPVGSRFLFTIPLAAASSTKIESPEGRSIMVCHDDAPSSVVEVLERSGFRVVQTTSPELLACATRLRPDAIVLSCSERCRAIPHIPLATGLH
jgi:hypothetical protein